MRVMSSVFYFVRKGILGFAVLRFESCTDQLGVLGGTNGETMMSHAVFFFFFNFKGGGGLGG